MKRPPATSPSTTYPDYSHRPTLPLNPPILPHADLLISPYFPTSLLAALDANLEKSTTTAIQLLLDVSHQMIALARWSGQNSMLFLILASSGRLLYSRPCIMVPNIRHAWQLTDSKVSPTMVCCMHPAGPTLEPGTCTASRSSPPPPPPPPLGLQSWALASPGFAT